MFLNLENVQRSKQSNLLKYEGCNRRVGKNIELSIEETYRKYQMNKKYF